MLKHMFTLEALKEDATLLLDLKEDVREECSQLGEVTNVVLYDVSLQIEIIFGLYRLHSEARTRRNHDDQIQRPIECSSVYFGTQLTSTVSWIRI